MTIRKIAEDNKKLITDLSAYDPSSAVPLLASLLTLPDYQSHCIRFESLVALAMVYCNGQKKAQIAQAKHWFSQIGKSHYVMAEDPAEDVFVSLVQDENGDYRLLGGIWEGAGFYTQIILDVIATMPDEEPYGQIKKSVRALLIISDIVCEKAGLQRYQLGSDELHSEFLPNKALGRNELVSHITIAFTDLERYEIKRTHIEPFILQPQLRNALAEQELGNSDLDRCPLSVFDESHVVVTLPSSLTVALRGYVIKSVIEGGLIKSFDENLAIKYAQLFYETPLLGGPICAPVRWIKLSAHRRTTFTFEVDKGYYISYHLFLPSVQAHADGGFEAIYQVEDALHQAVQESIDNTLAHFENDSDFKKGLVILVGCNLGNSYVIQGLKLDHPNWQFQSMIAADLVRLSWVGDMSPSYLWRVLDGLDAVTNAGVRIMNLSGIMNLVGWVRSNHGHLIPHEEIPEGEFTSENPLDLILPTNMLREIRAAADQGYDCHRSLDHIGRWHDVRHISPNPFFSSESSRRVYASMDDVKSRTMTSVYEGTLHLWITVEAPNTTNTDVQYRLFEMANEWLHRIGTVLDTRTDAVLETLILKVHVEFRDVDPPEYCREKPDPKDLVKLCIIEGHSEPNAYKAVFEVGFLDGFLIAENIAERLFVRNLSRAFLKLLDAGNADKEAQAVEAQVVQNNEARHFHLLHAQGFTDYVRDTLPKNLVAIDPTDDAAARIGLGWRVHKREKGNRIKGRENCTQYLGKIVDALVDEIVTTLSTFDRVSTLKQLVANCEIAGLQKDQWEKTSAAILGLHGQSSETVRTVVEQISKFDGARNTSRILIEMAVCVCPLEGGSQLSEVEMGKLIARVALVIFYGGMSDAIYYNVLAPEIKISPFGDILFRDELGHLVVKPMLSRMIGDQFVENAPSQKKNYEEPEVVADSRERVGDEFWEIWTHEMGFNPDEARDIIGSLEDKGIHDHAAIFEISQSEYYSLVCSNSSVTKKTAGRFLNQFSLETRAQWENPPKGFSQKDIYPWRFRRKLSFVARPILKIDNSDDPLLIIAPGVLRMGFAYLFCGAHSGRFEQSFFKTKEMKDAWWGKAREGHSFNSAVAKTLSDAGWKIRENINLSEILNRQIERDFGDVDVLAWRADRNEVLVIECKNLSPAINYSEIAALLSDYQGVEVDGKADKLRKHLDRVSLLQENKEQLQRFTNIQNPKIVSCLICSGTVPMQYARVDALSSTHVGAIENILAILQDT